ncbi:hypothetical protein M3C74_05340 [Micrococcus lylae]|uniref:hypothetical protein n=1 Tax=Micrococcus lylae TaxID=1273 RepID=UPI0021A3FAC9|nr:hypothetical protein [Micrococcus lylae]MCT2007516.1 hypothetical protein [Micrococcus lylae]MCT2071257.1 hypothetical protein [Micrococcus lylae]
MRIDPTVSTVQVGPGQVQVGNGPRAVVVDVRPRGVRTLLAELSAGTVAGRGSAAALARRCGMEETELALVLEGLAPVLVEGAGADVAADPGADSAADPGADGRRDSGGNETQVAPAPSRALPDAVHVDGLGPTGAAVADLLAAAGVGRFGLTDQRPVRAEELGHGLVTADVGRPRNEALAQRLGDRGVAAVACHPAGRRAIGAVTVTVAAGAWDADRLARAQAGGHIVLPVVLRDEDTLVGPWCAPDVPGCPLCWERWAGQEDPLRAQRTAALHRAGAGRDPVERARLTACVVVAALKSGPVPGLAWRVRDQAPGPRSSPLGVDEESVAPWPGCACGR